MPKKPVDLFPTFDSLQSRSPKHFNMKKLITLIAAILISINHFAQAPQKMSYQAVIRNASNNLVTNAPVKMRISILQGSATGTSVYSELHSATTNANGLVSIEIGAGTSPIGTFSLINWGNGAYFLKTETDPNNGTNYTVTGTSQLLSVPYALESKNSETSKSAGDGIKGVSSTGDTLYLNNGKSIIIPGISNANPNTVTGITTHICGAINVHNPAIPYGTMTDQEGNVYRTVQIGTQTWMAENLKTEKYRNGESILNIIDQNEWNATPQTGRSAFCDYNNDKANNCPYGKLYNWYAVNDSRNICPTSWHVPSESEFNVLVKFLDPSVDTSTNCYACYQSGSAGGKLKSAGNQYWDLNIGGSNSSGFSFLPGGFREGGFSSIRGAALLWSSTSTSTFYARNYTMPSYDTGFYSAERFKFHGYAVRCVKD